MPLSDELEHLARLHQQGALSDDEFARAKARVIGGRPGEAPPGTPLERLNTLRRSRADRWIGGVCGGIATATGVTAWVWRLLFALTTLCAGGGALLYVLLWILIPVEPGSSTPSGAYRPGEPAH